MYVRQRGDAHTTRSPPNTRGKLATMTLRGIAIRITPERAGNGQRLPTLVSLARMLHNTSDVL